MTAVIEETRIEGVDADGSVRCQVYIHVPAGDCPNPATARMHLTCPSMHSCRGFLCGDCIGLLNEGKLWCGLCGETWIPAGEC